MLSKVSMLLRLTFLLSIISSCASLGLFGSKATLQISKPYFSGGAVSLCQMPFVLLNEETARPVKAVVEVIFFDRDNNTLAQTTVYFDPVLAGKKQVKESFAHTRCEMIAKMVVLNAYEDFGNGYVRELPDIKGRVFTFGSN